MRMHDHARFGRHVVMTQAEWDDTPGPGPLPAWSEEVRASVAQFTGIGVYIDTCPCDDVPA